MNKSELITIVAEKAGLTKKQASDALDATLEEIQNAVTAGDKVSFIGFGTFERRDRAARTGRNPQTNEIVNIPASSVPAFKPGKAFKDRVKK